ncbi:hypothetical protein R1flu_010121 [Riccia fluitans]|uniref:BHLH domain-containing protein n=1 Tax=Riccia fluitans TaxID=41844 RepID=A0ABD1Z568_9MARC
MSEMFSWINNACADSTTAGISFSPFVSTAGSSSSVDAGADFGRMLGAVPRELQPHLNDKSMYRVLQPWTESTVSFQQQQQQLRHIPGGDGFSNYQLEGSNHLGFWSTYPAGPFVQPQHEQQQQHNPHQQSVSKQQLLQHSSSAGSIAKLDSVPATPPLLSDIVTLVCSSSASYNTTEGCDKVPGAGQLPNGFATFIDSLPIPYGAASNTAAAAGGINQSQFSFGNVNSTCSAASAGAAADIESAISRPNCKLEPGKCDAQSKSGSVYSLDGKDDQVKKILSKCGKWAESATASKSLEWTTVGLEKSSRFHGRATKKATEGPAAAAARQQQPHHRSFRPVPSEKAEHVQRERERRIQLRAMYKTLDTLVPAQSRTAKRDRTTIVNDALNYVKEMRRKLEKLQAYKSKSIMSIALSELLAQNIDKRKNQGLAAAGDRGKASSPKSTSAVDDVEHREGIRNAGVGIEETADASIILTTPDVHVFTGSSDQVLINIHCGSRPDLLSRTLKALDLLQLDVSHYSFSRLCAQFVSCHFAAKVRTSADMSGLSETIREVLVDSLG